jgi:hypothetical protein
MPMTGPTILWIQIQKTIFHNNSTVVFRVCGEAVKRLLEHEFYGLALRMWRKVPNQQHAGE